MLAQIETNYLCISPYCDSPIANLYHEFAKIKSYTYLTMDWWRHWYEQNLVR